jgi:peptidylprolyl isomerase domain and WD repeat-containing protein 1
MSDSDNDNTVLGKRPRNRGDAEESPETTDTAKMEVVEDESDDDVGPMPMPAGAGNGAAKKKRKGVQATVRKYCCVLTRTGSVLPHEKLYLDHLPSADRYYKSFMHREVINFNVITKCASDHSRHWHREQR